MALKISHRPLQVYNFSFKKWYSAASSAVMIVNLLLGVLLAASTTRSALDIQLPSGIFTGQNMNGLDRWLGIPFALPPVGDLRFKAPVPVRTNLSLVRRNATTFGNACPQPPGNLGASISEDCLYLNVRDSYLVTFG